MKLLILSLALATTVLALDRVCLLKKEPGPCTAFYPRYYYDQDVEECVEFIYGGCKGNKNNFKTLKECKKYCEDSPAVDPLVPTHDVCKLEKEPGYCKKYLTRYYYDKDTDECEKFIYGGCGGNKNNFKTLEDCEDECGYPIEPKRPRRPYRPVPKDICKLKKEEGHCHDNIPRYFYNKFTKECEEFFYSGCGGNENNFKTLEKCERHCHNGHAPPPTGLPTPDYVCKLDKDPGHCKAYIPRYYFDKYTKECKKFIYGGCKGNKNNFLTEKECWKTCHKGSLPYIPKKPCGKIDDDCILGGVVPNGLQSSPKIVKLLPCCKTLVCCAPCSPKLTQHSSKPILGTCQKSCKCFLKG